MSTIVCQNLVSCFDSQLTETTATLKLRVAAAPPPPPANLSTADHSLELGNWGFLRMNDSQESSYTHPLSKNPSYSKLSPKSLQLCTENLGSETGSDTASDCSSIFSASPPLSPSSTSGDDRKTFDDCKQRRIPTSPSIEKSCRKIKNFPPPLTTMSGGSSLQVRRHVEGGRLIMEAVEGPFRNSYLHAERSDGRLKLSFATATSTAVEEQDQEVEEVEEENLDECGGAAAAAEEEEIEEARNEIVESEMEGEKNMVEKYQRFRRCKESGHGNKGLCNNWKPALWVATS